MSFAMHGLVQSVGHSDELIHEFARLQQGGVAMQLHREYSPGRRLKQREGNKQNSPPAQPTPTTHRTAKSIHAIPGIATVVSKKPTLAVEDKSWPFLNPNEWRCVRWTPVFGRLDKVELRGWEAPYQEQDDGWEATSIRGSPQCQR